MPAPIPMNDRRRGRNTLIVSEVCLGTVLFADRANASGDGSKWRMAALDDSVQRLRSSAG